ncbi:MAG: hypothetical protein Q7J29_13355 [Stagnimonas sp.]|nr:hypothetical protein [Stagnimonas sp.]
MEQIAAPGSQLRLHMQGEDNAVFIRQAGAGHRADVLLDGRQIGTLNGAGSVVQSGEGQRLALLATGERIGFDLRQHGAAGNRIDAALRGEDLLLQASQQSSSPLGPQRLSATLEGSGHRAEISQTGSSDARLLEANSIQLVQSGSDNLALLRQQGNGNVIEVEQRGSRNQLQIDQQGQGNVAEVVQLGNDIRLPTITQSGGAQLRIITRDH